MAVSAGYGPGHGGVQPCRAGRCGVQRYNGIAGRDELDLQSRAGEVVRRAAAGAAFRPVRTGAGWADGPHPVRATPEMVDRGRDNAAVDLTFGHAVSAPKVRRKCAESTPKVRRATPAPRKPRPLPD